MIEVRVQPGAKTAGVERMGDGHWKVRLRARAIEGQANAALIAQLAEWLDVPRGAVRIAQGLTGRQKTIAIAGLDDAAVAARLDAVR